MKRREHFYDTDPRPGKFKERLADFIVTLLVIIGLIFLATKVYAGEEHTGSQPDLNASGHGSVWLLPSTGNYIEALQLESDVNIDVSGMIARATVKQKFRNTSSLWAEGLYVFPLPENAAVDHFKLIVDGRIIEGQIQEKEQARKAYETAKRQGKRAGLVEQQRTNVFTTKLANIAPGAEMMVEIEYQQSIVYRDGEYSLRFPLVVGERYLAPSNESKIQPDYDTSVYTESSRTSKNVNPTSITINLDTGITVSSIESLSHPIVINPLNDNHYIISLRDKNVPADRDFLLSWTPQLTDLPSAAVFNQKLQNDEYALITIYPPQSELYNQLNVPREVVFILDVSGSMSGTSISQAKAALMLALDRLKPSDKFNVIWFNNMAKKVFFESRHANDDEIEHAKKFVSNLDADGGTEMLPALQLAMSSKIDPYFLRQLVFITDGNVSNERDLFNYINDNLGEGRLFTVGIGSAPNSFFMKKAAKAGRGTYTFISNVREVGKKMALLFRKLETPALTDIKVTSFGDNIKYFPQPIPDMYIGEPVTILLRGQNLLNSIIVSGKIGSDPWQQIVDVNQGSFNSGVSTAWARAEIAALTQSYFETGTPELKAGLKQKITETSLKHHLVSRFTSLVAVDVTPVNQSGELYQEQIQNNKPYGWTDAKKQQARTAHLPQGGTDLFMHFTFAMMFLTIALMLRIMRLGHDY